MQGLRDVSNGDIRKLFGLSEREMTKASRLIFANFHGSHSCLNICTTARIGYIPYVEFILKVSEFFTPFGELIDRRGKPS